MENPCVIKPPGLDYFIAHASSEKEEPMSETGLLLDLAGQSQQEPEQGGGFGGSWMYGAQ